MPDPAPHERDRAILHALGRRIDPSDAGAQNNLGVLFYEKGMVPEAIGAFSRALELDPRMALARRNLEHVHRESGYFDRRVTELAERLRREPDLADARLELGRAYLGLGRHDAAEAEFRRLLERRPDDATALTQLGLVAQARGRHDIAVDWFSQAVAAGPESAVARRYLAEALYNQGLNEPALEVLEAALALGRDDPDLHFLLGFVLGDLGRHEAARAATRRAIELNPTLAEAQANLAIAPGLVRRPTPPPGSIRSPLDGPAPHTALGLAFRSRGYLAEALREYRMGLEAGEDRTTILEALAEVHLLRRDYAPALELLDALLERQPGNPRLWNQRGVVLQQAGRREEARDAYRRAVAADPTAHYAWNNLGVVTAGDRQGQEAEEAFRAALRVRPSFAPARLNLGLLQFGRERYQEALEEYRGVLAEVPHDAVAWNGVGLVLMELRRTTDARNAFTRAVEADPDNAAARYNLAFSLSQSGDYDGALRETRRALELDPYYVPQKYALTLDLPDEEGSIAVAPDLSTDTRGGVGADFVFDPSILDTLFEELAPAESPPTRAAEGEDPFGLARDYLAKGLLELATAEVNRAVGRGAPRALAGVLLGEVYARRGLHGEALDRFRAAREVVPDDPRALLGESFALLALDRAGEALPLADRLVALSPRLADGLVARARARLATDQAAGALADIRAAAELAPGRADLYLLEGTASRRLGETDAALSACRAALAVDARLAQAWVEIAEIEEEREHAPEAREAYRRVLEILPTHGPALLALGRLLCHAGRPGEAVTLLADHLQAEPYALEVILLLGRALHQDSRPQEALRAFDRVIRFAPEHAEAHFHRGAALAALRQYREAIAEWDRVLVLAPRGPLATAARDYARSARELERILQPSEG